MSLLPVQTFVNANKEFYLRSIPGLSSASQFVPNPLPYNTPFIIQQDSNAPAGDIDAQASILGAGNQLYIQSPTQITIKQNNITPIATQINTDATAQNFLPGIITSTTMVAQGGFVGTGLTGRGLTLQTRDTDNNFFGQFQFNTPQSGVGQSTLSVVYLNQNPIAPSNVMVYDPTVNPAEIRIPEWNLSTSAMNVSSINGGIVPSDNALQILAQPTFTNGVQTQGVRTVATVNTSPLVAGGVYQYDVGVSLTNAVPGNAGNAPSFPFNVLFGIRLGGSGGSFDYGYTVPIQSGGGLGSTGNEFVLSGLVRSANPITSNILEVVTFFGQVDTNCDFTFGSVGDADIYLRQIA
jgi:hypothetical protein